MSEIVPRYINDFIRYLLPKQNAFLEKLKEECEKEYIPLVEPEIGQFLLVMVMMKNPRHILEIGTGIGYSSLLLAEVIKNRGGRITTIEIDRSRYERACHNFRAAGLEKIVTPLFGDANEIIPALKGSFDFIFMDAAKGQYPGFFRKIWPLFEPDGVLVIDNVFLNGWVVDMTWPERRKKTMVVRMRELLENLKENEELQTTVIPLGDGIAVGIRRSPESCDEKS